jgi:signal transduction histidine kinase
MKIIAKIILVITIFCCIAVLIMSFASNIILDENYRNLEDEMISAQVIQFQQAIESEMNDVASKVGDWAPWDDTYYFVVDEHPEYINDNLMIETFQNLRMNIMVFINSTGSLYYAKSVDYLNGETTNLSEGLIDYISYSDTIFNHQSLDEIKKGILILSEDPLFYATMPIITSGYEGPSHGTLFMGRYLDSNEIEYLRELTNLNVTLCLLDSGSFIKGLDSEISIALEEGSIVTKPVSEDTIVGYSIVESTEGTKGLLIELISSRALYQQGKHTILTIQIIIGLLGLIFGSLFLFIVYSTVINRVTNLNKQVKEIGKDNSFSQRVKLNGTDEVSMLAQGINNALNELEINRENLAELNKTLEMRVQHRTAEVKALLKHKDDFINQLGHDLKNPLGPLINLLPVIKKHITEGKDKEIVDTLIRNVDYMKNLVIKTIELAQLSSPNTMFNLEQIQLGPLVETVLRDNRYNLQTKNLQVETKIPTDFMVTGDRLRLQELFVNLLNNSIKFSPPNGIIRIDTKLDFFQITISIADQGIGMNEEQLNHVFDEFYKADESRHDFDSSGLGMPISKRIVEKHGGCIWAESNGIGKGSTFYFTLPIQHTQSTEQKPVETTGSNQQVGSYMKHQGHSHDDIINEIDRLFTVH